MSNFNLNLTAKLLYNERVNLSFDAFSKNEQMNVWTITKVSETDTELIVKIDDNTATFTKINSRIDFDYDAFKEQAEIFEGFEYYTFRHDALQESKDHKFHIDLKKKIDLILKYKPCLLLQCIKPMKQNR